MRGLMSRLGLSFVFYGNVAVFMIRMDREQFWKVFVDVVMMRSRIVAQALILSNTQIQLRRG